jgi:hypothetical protein
MGALTVGTAVYSNMAKPSKWHCQCMMEDGREVYIAVKALTSVEASMKAHNGYNVDYVLDILTHDQMEHRKRHLKPSLIGAVSSY